MKAPETVLVKVYLLPGDTGSGFEVFHDRKLGMDFIMVPENEQTKHLRFESKEQIKSHFIPHIFGEDVPGYAGNCSLNPSKIRGKSMRNSPVLVVNTIAIGK
jgi:hypothetical protein